MHRQAHHSALERGDRKMESNKNIEINGIDVPSFFYGTAWKEERTQELTELALQYGFRAIDTANQRKHYFEEGVGRAIESFLKRSDLSRKDLFLQTKFTFADSQDHRMPYKPGASIKSQVKDSFESSLQHLKTDYIDSYILHGPSKSFGLGQSDHEAWQSMEELYIDGKCRLLGISNVNIEQLSILCDEAKIKPSFVQNRCFAASAWDVDVREFCREQKIQYQGFSLLTANQLYLQSQAIHEMAKNLQRSVPELIFRFAIDVGMIPLCGSKNPEHLKEDLSIYDFHLGREEISIIEQIAKVQSLR